MTDSTQQARAAVTAEDVAVPAAKTIAALNREHLEQFRDWKVGDPVE